MMSGKNEPWAERGPVSDVEITVLQLSSGLVQCAASCRIDAVGSPVVTQRGFHKRSPVLLDAWSTFLTIITLIRAKIIYLASVKACGSMDFVCELELWRVC